MYESQLLQFFVLFSILLSEYIFLTSDICFVKMKMRDNRYHDIGSCLNNLKSRFELMRPFLNKFKFKFINSRGHRVANLAAKRKEIVDSIFAP